MNWIRLAFAGLFLGCADDAFAGPEDVMFKIVYHDEISQAGTFGAKPKTFYRWGDTKSRLEEACDPAEKLQQLMISNGKNDWIANLADGTAMHITDPGPTYNVEAPIVPPDQPGKPPKVRDFQFTRELESMTNHHVAPVSAKLSGTDCELYEMEEAGYKLELYVDPRTNHPLESVVSDEFSCLTRIVYDEYHTDLKPDPALFMLPPNIRVTENH